MNNKKASLFNKTMRFLSGKGFYIVLLLCVAVIGVSAYGLLVTTETTMRESNIAVTASVPSNTGSGGIRSTPAPTPVPTAEPESPTSVADDQEQTDNDPAPTEQTDVGEEEEPVEVFSSEDSMPDQFVWPVQGEIEQSYSVEALVYNKTTADWRTHDGIDIAAPLGAKVAAVAPGIVEEVTKDRLYGTTVVIRHGGGLYSVYANLAIEPPVQAGEEVSMGQVIGSVGDTAVAEAADATHLHFAMELDGATVDPTEYLQ